MALVVIGTLIMTTAVSGVQAGDRHHNPIVKIAAKHLQSNRTTANCTTNNGTYVGNGTNTTCGNGTSGNTTNTTGCSSYTTETACILNVSCVWDPVTVTCYYDDGSNSGSNNGNTTNTTGCWSYATAAACTADSSCAWNYTTGYCYNSTNPNCTTNNGTYVGNGTNTTCGNGTSGNNTFVLGSARLHHNLKLALKSSRNATRRSRRAPNTRCRAARVAHHCGAIKACFWDNVGSLCREAVVSSVDAVAQPGSTVVRSTNTTPKSSVAALVACAACAALVVASVIGAAVLRARRGRKADEAERVPIVRADGVSSDMEA